MRIGGLIVGSGIGAIVRDGRTLNAMERAGHFVRPHSHQPYVDNDVNGERRPYRFTWKNGEYQIRYFDGCFYPFVVRIS